MSWQHSIFIMFFVFKIGCQAINMNKLAIFDHKKQYNTDYILFIFSASQCNLQKWIYMCDNIWFKIYKCLWFSMYNNNLKMSKSKSLDMAWHGHLLVKHFKFLYCIFKVRSINHLSQRVFLLSNTKKKKKTLYPIYSLKTWFFSFENCSFIIAKNAQAGPQNPEFHN